MEHRAIIFNLACGERHYNHDPFSDGIKSSQGSAGKAQICSKIQYGAKAHLKLQGLASPALDRRNKYRPRNYNGELARSWGFPP